MKTTLPLIISLIALVQPLAAKGRRDRQAVDPPAVESHHKVQIALLLDTSSSMDGLIDQAKTQLWKVVNTFIDARRDGVAPFVEVALFEYGNNNQPVGSHYIRQIQPLTRDLDEVSKQITALTTNGGEEYCGAVIQRAITDLTWDKDPKTYKAIFIAGNEPFTQGPVDPREACKESYAKGIIVNTIHCGPRDTGMSGSWHDGAAIAGGKFMVIDQDRAVCHIPAPQDKKISDLGIELNKTYLDYLRVLSREADRLSHLVENVLAFSRIERGNARSNVREVPVGELLEQSRERLEARLATAGLHLEMDTHSTTPVRADTAAVEHILFNLIDNAAKYASNRSPAIVKIQTRDLSNKVEILVTDHGPGIAPAEMSRIFRAFHKSAREAAESQPGVGLGLALSRRLAREQGGGLTCQTPPPHSPGACFILQLPRTTSS
jgi:anti-sigma regulatory factor (Ser/Thr protein kinase)